MEKEIEFEKRGRGTRDFGHDEFIGTSSVGEARRIRAQEDLVMGHGRGFSPFS